LWFNQGLRIDELRLGEPAAYSSQFDDMRGANSVFLWMFPRIAAERSAEEATHDRQTGAK